MGGPFPRAGLGAVTNAAEHQRAVTRAALAVLGRHGFALAGSGAIREHSLVDRPTQDVDLFTNSVDAPAFAAAVEDLTAQLVAAGYQVKQERRAALFAQLQVMTPGGDAVSVDLATDWRSQEPVALAVGPVLSVQDAVASKVGALYTRTEARDYLDVDAIRTSGRFTDTHLLTLVADRDPGFDSSMFAHQLDQVQRVNDGAFARYGLDVSQVAAMRDRLSGWAATIRNPLDEQGPSAAGLVANPATEPQSPAPLPPEFDAPGREQHPQPGHEL